jgi:hypothetical protein
MATIIKLSPHLSFPHGNINLDQVAKAYVTMPLTLIQYMDTLVISFPSSASSDEIKLKAAPAAKILRKKLAEALANGSKSQWVASNDPPPFIHRNRGVAGSPVAIGFVMQRRDMDGRKDVVSVRVNCGDSPSAGRLDCEVVPWY